MNKNYYAVIMAGGVGSRFYPMSTRTRPKQFLDILGTGKSFIRHTFERRIKLLLHLSDIQNVHAFLDAKV